MGSRFISHKNEPESHLNGKNKSQDQILRGGEDLLKYRKYSIAIFVDFVKKQSFLTK
jgi:hypothetical protein